MSTVHFDKIALIGIGLIGSSLARVIRREKLADHIAIATRSGETLKRAEELALGDSYTTDSAEAVRMPISSSCLCRSARQVPSRARSLQISNPAPS